MGWQEVATAAVVGGAILSIVWRFTGGFRRRNKQPADGPGCNRCDGCD